MLKKNWKFILNGLMIAIVLFNFSIFLSPVDASTQADLKDQLNKTGLKAGWVQATPTTLAEIIKYAITAFLGLLGVIFLVLIIYAGFNWMTAQGDENKVTMAKDTLVRAVIGLIIIIAAYSITYFVFSNLPGGGSGSGGGGGEPL